MAILRLPWFVAAPSVAGAALVMALGLNYLLSDYFIRTFVDEADPLAAIPSTSADATPDAQMTPLAAAATGTPATAAPSSTAAPESTQPAAAEPTQAPATAEPVQSPAVMAGVISEGEFRDGDPGHIGSGTARILRDGEGKLYLRLENFSVTNGPDLRVYLSTTGGYSGDSLELGKLKATDGNQNYEIPEGVDVSAFQSALIWCEPFSVLFAIATLEVLP